MESISHSELNDRRLRLRHLFFPGLYGFVSETIIAVLALVFFNITWLSSRLISENFGTANPLLSWPHLVGSLLDKVGQYYAIQQVVLFTMWAVVGTLIYMLLFRMLQIGLGVTHSVGRGVQYVKQDSRHGIFRWLGSLHDFFFKLLIVLSGTAALALGSLVCFSIASQELNNALVEPFPQNALSMAISFVAALVSVRVVAFGITMLSPRFRDWYTV